MFRILLVVAAVLALGACSAMRPMTLSEARSYCNTADGGGSSDEDGAGGSCRQQLEICAGFFDLLAVGTWTRQACLDHCGSVESVLFHEHAMDDCGQGVQRAGDLCEAYCRSNFPQ